MGSSGQQVAVDLDRQCFATELVDDVERAEAASVPQPVKHEVNRPTPVDLVAGNQRHRLPVRHRLLAGSTAIELNQSIHAPYAHVISDQLQLAQLVEATLRKPLT